MSKGESGVGWTPRNRAGARSWEAGRPAGGTRIFITGVVESRSILCRGIKRADFYFRKVSLTSLGRMGAGAKTGRPVTGI